ncbi:hypothetical protein GB928_028545 [Shinella curvata]|uniref:Uncharacterized protein n=1 Tax=Shinella curvata TaxID=1817964 RepID=A0ABT8XPN6_9HYPH|nr:hypothetical protein [Shinella curvata]MCJ8056162.1 hypothetical protein [Shinella curvata]MDO6125135.1 hypothetical protein [Shinella curvata]
MAIDNSVHLEGRINAHRRLMVELVSLLGTIPEAQEALRAMARDNETVIDHQEDPGLEPDVAFAVQQIADDEIRGILKAAMTRLETKV